jgi:hypothetical protein
MKPHAGSFAAALPLQGAGAGLGNGPAPGRHTKER